MEEKIGTKNEIETSSSPFKERYSFKSLKEVLKKLTWLTRRETLTSFLSVVLVALISASILYWADEMLAALSINLRGSVDLSVFKSPAFESTLIVSSRLIQAFSALMLIFLSLKRPSPGENVASIFAGASSAQNSKVSPKEAKRDRRMALSFVLFILTSIMVSVLVKGM